MKYIVATIACVPLLFAFVLFIVGARSHSPLADLPLPPQTAAVSGSGSGLIAYYTFDEGSGTVANDTSGSGNNGTLKNGVAWTTGKMGGAAQFNGINSYVDLDTNPSLKALKVPYTVAFWEKTDSLSQSGLILSMDTTDAPSALAAGIIGGNIYAGKNASKYAIDKGATKLLTANTWQHWAIVFDGTNKGQLYIDGVPQNSNIADSYNVNKFQIGARADGSAYPFKGAVDDFRIYNRALSASEVASVIALGGNSVATPPPAPSPTPSPTPAPSPAPTPSPAVSTTDTTVPTVSIVTPLGGATVTGTVSITVNANDNVGIAGVKFMLDGVQFGTEDTTSPYSTSWDTNSVAKGSTHTLTAIARDAAGNTATSKAVSVTVAAAVPTITPAPAPAINTQISVSAPIAGLVAKYTFDEGSGNIANDTSGRNHNGTLTNGPQWINAGRLGGALHFDGVDDYVTIPFASDFDVENNGALTVSAWIKAEDFGSITNRRTIVQDMTGGSTNIGWHFAYEPTHFETVPILYDVFSGHLRGDYSDPSARYGSLDKPAHEIPNGGWNHVAFVYNKAGGVAKTYLNGVLEDQDLAGRGITLDRTLAVTIGSQPSQLANSSFHGVIDEVQIYNTALSQAQVQQLLAEGLTSTSDGVMPTVSITSPASDTIIHGTVPFTANATDNVGVVGVQFRVDGHVIGTEDTTAPYATTVDTRTLSDGQHIFAAWARDAVGNIKSAVWSTVTVSNGTVDTSDITNIRAVPITASSQQVLWRTAVPTNSRVEYGQTTSYGSMTSLDANLNTSHQQTITGLAANTTYHFRILSGSFVSADQTFTTVSASTPGTFTVNQNGTGHFSSIQTCVSSVAPGSTCVVAPGTYYERVKVEKPNLTIRATNKADLNRRSQNSIVFGFDLRTDHIKIDGFDITGLVDAPFEGSISVYRAASYCTLVNNTIHDTIDRIRGIWFQETSTGIATEGASHCVIDGNTFKNIHNFVTSIQGVGNTITHNVFDTSNGWDAIRIFGADSLIKDNYFVHIDEVENIGNHVDIIQTFDDCGTSTNNVPNYDCIESRNILFEHNFIEDSDTQIAQLANDRPTTKIRNWTFKNNVFANMRHSFNLNAQLPGMTFINNTFYNTGAIIMGNVAVNSLVKNNVFLSNGEPPTSPQRAWYQIWPNSAPSFNAHHNYVAGSGAAYLPKSTTGCSASTPYPSMSFCEEILGHGGINGGDPVMQNEANVLGPDGIPFTDDDGLRPLSASPLCHAADDGGDIGAYSCKGCVGNTPIPAFSANTLSGYEPLAVSFDARSSSACSGSLTYSWDFGDGATATGAQVNHTYRQGTWNVLLTVTNSANVSAIKQKQVTVLPSVEPNLDLYIGFNNNITDLSGRGHVGAWQGVPSYTGGIIQQGGVTGGSNNSYITLPHDDSLDGMNRITYAIWAKRAANNSAGGLIGKATVYSLGVDSANTVRATLVNQAENRVDLSASLGPVDLGWHQYAVTYDGSRAALYVDGQPAGTQKSFTGNLYRAIYQEFFVGKDPFGATFNGVIDEARLYSRALTAPDILDLYNRTRNNQPPPPPSSNVPPTVSVTAPLPNTPFSAPASISITANASDSDGTISKVEFYNGQTLLGSDTTSPYAYTWNNVGAGTYSVTAKAYDNANATTQSSAVSVVVTSALPPNTPPTASITAPLANAVYTLPVSIPITVTAADVDGSVSSIDIMVHTVAGTTTLTTLTTPSTYTWRNPAVGEYTITAKVTDNDGGIGWARFVPVRVEAAPVPNILPTVSITAPGHNAVFTAPAPVPINTVASDADGTISSVTLYAYNTVTGTSTLTTMNAQGAYIWHNVAAGTYRLMAKATDNDGGVTFSAPVVVVMNPAPTPNIAPVVAITAPAATAPYTAPADITITVNATDADGTVSSVILFAYNANTGTTTLATIGARASYTWNNVGVGTYRLTAKAIDNDGASSFSSPVSVVVSPAPVPNVIPTASITAPIANAVYTLPVSIPITVTAADTDGTIASIDVVVHGDAGTTTLATLRVPGTYTWRNPTVGEYTITAKVTDNDGGIGWARFVPVRVEAAPVPNILPTATITSPAPNASFRAPANIPVVFNARDTDGTITSVDILVYNTISGTTTLLSTTRAHDTHMWARVPAGSYILYAQATDNSNAVALSAPVPLTVTPPIVPAPDADMDGVPDSLDRCPDTAPASRLEVNRDGCSIPRIDNFQTNLDPETTDLTRVRSFELTAPRFGGLRFNASQDVSLLNSTASGTEALDFDRYLVIEQNKISADSTQLPIFAHNNIATTTVTLYNITVPNPKILHDGVECTTCTIVSYSNHTLVFTVQGFSTYEIVNTVTTSSPPTRRSGGSGRGGSYITQPTTPAPQVIVGPSVPVRTYGTLTRTLVRGMRGADVTLLQQFLIDKGWLLVPAPTGLYGVGTEAAVAKFQLAQGIVTSRASSGYGRVGPRTMAALNAAMAGYSGDISAPPTVSMPGAPVTAPSAPAASSFTRTLSVGMSGNDVLRLQRLLNSLGFTIAASGPGSPGHENTYFGPATKQALIRFQETYAQDILTPAGLTKGTGSLGPATRRKIDSF